MKQRYQLTASNYCAQYNKLEDTPSDPILVRIEDGRVGIRQVSLQVLVAAYDKLNNVDNGFTTNEK